MGTRQATGDRVREQKYKRSRLRIIVATNGLAIASGIFAKQIRCTLPIRLWVDFVNFLSCFHLTFNHCAILLRRLNQQFDL